MLSALLATAQRMEQSGEEEAAQRLRDLHRRALRLSMQAKLQSD
jgi:hypothetical protein